MTAQDTARRWLESVTWTSEDGLEFADDAPGKLIEAFARNNLTSDARGCIAVRTLEGMVEQSVDPGAITNDPRAFIREQSLPVYDEWHRIVQEERPGWIQELTAGEGKNPRELFARVADAVAQLVAEEIKRATTEEETVHE